MSNIKFLINNKIEILYKHQYFKSSIQDISEEYIVISIPTSEGMFIPFSVGEKLEVIYYGDNEIYKFYSMVKGTKFSKIPIIILSIPNKFEKVQRRRYVRIPYVEYINYNKVSDKIKDLSILKHYFEDEDNLKKAILVDISGGGLRVKVSQSIKEGDILAMMLPLEDENIIVKCKIVRVDMDFDEKYDCGLTFMNLDDRTREKIIQFIFKLMRKHMKKI